VPNVERVTDGRETGTDKLVVHFPKIKNIMYVINSLCPEYSSVVDPDPHRFGFFSAESGF
jgi:hypothetical protein